jgi:hypothetical protein
MNTVTFSSIIGIITMTLSLLIYELAPLWLVLDLIGMTAAFIGLKKGDRNCKTGMILCGAAALFSFSSVLIMFLANR